MYAFWRQHGLIKNKDYRENLCHYVRVVLIWAPMAWMYNARLYKGKISPNQALLALSYLTMCVIVVSRAQSAITVAAILFGTPLLFLLAMGFERMYPGKMLRGCRKVGSVIEPPANWYFSKRLIGPVRPFMVVLAAVVVWLVWINPKYLVSVGTAIVFWSIMIVLAYFAHRRDERKREKRDLERKVTELESQLRSLKFSSELEALSQRMINRMITQEEYAKQMDALMKQIYPTEIISETAPVSTGPDRTNPWAEAFRLGVRFAAAKKHKICPFIVFDEDDELQLTA